MFEDELEKERALLIAVNKVLYSPIREVHVGQL